MTKEEVLAALHAAASPEHRAGLSRYGIPDARAIGVPMRDMQRIGRAAGRSTELACALWAEELYEARTTAVFVADPAEMTTGIADTWIADFDSWAICDTACFHLFDRCAFAWDRLPNWAASEVELTARAAFATLWGLTLHDKTAPDSRFEQALELIATIDPADRPMVEKGQNMALRATGKRNIALNAAALELADRLAASADPARRRIGRAAARELRSAKVRDRLERCA